MSNENRGTCPLDLSFISIPKRGWFARFDGMPGERDYTQDELWAIWDSLDVSGKATKLSVLDYVRETIKARAAFRPYLATHYRGLLCGRWKEAEEVFRTKMA